MTSMDLGGTAASVNRPAHRRATPGERSLLVAVLTAANVLVMVVVAQFVPGYVDSVQTSLARLVVTESSRWDTISKYLAMLGLLLVVELVVLGWRTSSLHRLVVPSPSARVDIVLAGLVITGYGYALALLFSGGLSTLVTTGAASASARYTVLAIDTPGLRWVVWFLIADFVKYVYHRACHTLQFLWQAHKVHHAATEFTVLTGNRVHPLEHAGLFICMAIPLLMTGATPGVLFGVYVVQRVIDWLQHSPVNWTYGWFGRWVVFSPIGHRIHHSPLPEHWDKNFGDFLVIWDRLFGTWYDGDVVNDEVGLSTGDWDERGPLDQLLDPGVWAFQDLWRSVRSGSWMATHVLERRESIVPSARSSAQPVLGTAQRPSVATSTIDDAAVEHPPAGAVGDAGASRSPQCAPSATRASLTAPLWP